MSNETNIDNKVRINNTTFNFKICQAIEPNEKAPVSSFAVHNELQHYTNLRDMLVAGEIDESSASNYQDNTLVTVGALVRFLQSKNLI